MTMKQTISLSLLAALFLTACAGQQAELAADRTDGESYTLVCTAIDSGRASRHAMGRSVYFSAKPAHAGPGDSIEPVLECDVSASNRTANADI